MSTIAPLFGIHEGIIFFYNESTYRNQLFKHYATKLFQLKEIRCQHWDQKTLEMFGTRLNIYIEDIKEHAKKVHELVYIFFNGKQKKNIKLFKTLKHYRIHMFKFNDHISTEIGSYLMMKRRERKVSTNNQVEEKILRQMETIELLKELTDLKTKALNHKITSEERLKMNVIEYDLKEAFHNDCIEEANELRKSVNSECNFLGITLD